MTREEEAIKILEEERMSLRRLAIDSNIPQLKPKYEAIDMAIEALEAKEWIPCSERLPETSVYVLATTNKGIITTAIIREGKTHSERYWWHRRSEFLDGEIVAWMPLPKPYNESRDYERAIEDMEYCEKYEQTYNPEDGSM